MIFIPRQEPFACEQCSKNVEPLEHGTYRNHCPHCLHSKCVDKDGPGDRASTCQALMRPIAMNQDSKRGWVITHECTKCGKQSNNKIAPDDDIVGFMNTNSEFIM